MLVELGNVAPKMANGAPAHLGAPAVTRLHIPDSYTWDPNVDMVAFRANVADAVLRGDGITHRPDDEALLSILHPYGTWRSHSDAVPSWIHSDAEGFAEAASAFHGGLPAIGRPADVEDTHWTLAGPPGVVPGAAVDLQALLVNSGRDIWARALGGSVVGATGTSTATGTTSMTDSGASWTTNAFAGMRVVCGNRWGIVVSNTGTVLTIDRWYTPTSPGGAAGSTPGATTVYVILDGNSPAWFVALTTTNITPGATDTSLSGEITTASGGLVRKIAPYAHTAGTNTYTLTPVYTANGSDSLPATVYAIGVFTSMVVSDTTSTMCFETSLSASATLSASGDQLTVTETVTGS